MRSRSSPVAGTLVMPRLEREPRGGGCKWGVCVKLASSLGRAGCFDPVLQTPGRASQSAFATGGVAPTPSGGTKC